MASWNWLGQKSSIRVDVRNLKPQYNKRQRSTLTVPYGFIELKT